MGCDIHAWIEVKRDGTWCSVDLPDGEDGLSWFRCYACFGGLAGVRGGPPIVEPRGLPEDANKGPREVWDQDWCHTPTWLTLAELIASERDERWNSESNWHDGDTPCAVRRAKRIVGLLPDSPEDIRVVFFFDN